MKIFKHAYWLPVLFGMISSVSCVKNDSAGTTISEEYCIPDSLLKNITLDTVKSENVFSELKLTGRITFDEDHVVKIFPLAGGHISDVKVSLGDFVQKGQLLASLRSSDMAGYFNDYKSAESELAIAKKNMDATADMRGSGIVSDKDYITAQSEYRKALAQFNKVNEVLKIYGSTQQAGDSAGSAYLIKAPISGFIVEKNITTGTELRPDISNNLFTISDLKEVWAIANVYECDISKVKEGDDVTVTTLSYPDKKFNGKVERISNILDPESKAMSVKIKLDNTDYILKPGMFANISLLFPETKKMLVVPENSIVFDDDKKFVIHYKKRCDVDLQLVKVIKSYQGRSYILGDSLQEGDLLIDRNVLFVFTALKKL